MRAAIAILCCDSAALTIRLGLSKNSWLGLKKDHVLAYHTCFGLNKHSWKLPRSLTKMMVEIYFQTAVTGLAAL